VTGKEKPMPDPVIADAKDALLLVVDMQTRLLNAMSGADEAIRNTAILIKAAREFGVPVLASEQYPAGLGHTHEDLAALLQPEEILPKVEFSCMGNTALANRIAEHGRKQIILVGVEAHVCVFQTAAGIAGSNRTPIVAIDATASRKAISKDIAAQRMNASGIIVATTEMVVFEWLGSASAPAFRTVSSLLR
jgi:nicotinamidase-related amidase